LGVYQRGLVNFPEWFRVFLIELSWGFYLRAQYAEGDNFANFYINAEMLLSFSTG